MTEPLPPQEQTPESQPDEQSVAPAQSQDEDALLGDVEDETTVEISNLGTPANTDDNAEAPAEETPGTENGGDESKETSEVHAQAGMDLSKSKLASGNAEGQEEEPLDEMEDETASEPDENVDPDELQHRAEALLFAAESPLSVREIARAAGSKSPVIRKLLKKISSDYDNERRPWQLVEVADGYRLVTRPQYFGSIQKLKSQRAQRKLTQAALETLALIAYSEEPVSRADVESIRGVGAGPVLRQLLDRRLIKIAGRGSGLGQPLLYAVTNDFLEHFGLRSTKDLPKASEFKGL